MINFSNVEMTYQPYPVGYVSSILDQQVYDEMLGHWPPHHLFAHVPQQLGGKYSLSEKNNRGNYERFVHDTPIWSRFHRLVKSPNLIESTFQFLKDRHIDLGLQKRKIVSESSSHRAGMLSRIRRITELSARFEFSMLSPSGGNILPHTDGPNKLITMVVSIITPGEWNPTWGGGTEICLPKDRSLVYNHLNNYLEFSDVEIIKKFPFVPNQCILFIKTYNSWHQVSPLHAGKDAPMRRTLTINIESKV